jgi:hypothetical protein
MELISNIFAIAIGFKNWHGVLPEDGTHVPKHVGEAHLMLVLIKNVHLFYVARTMHFGMKLYNDQHNAKVCNLFIYLFLRCMFRAFF